MTREIKFRGKREDTGEWLYGGIEHIRKCLGDGCYDNKANSVLVFVTEITMHGGQYGTWNVQGETIGQFTGLKDKDGVEIYEDDIYILGDPRIKYQVTWHDSGLIEKLLNSSYAGLVQWKDEIKVIGNIHDNPELQP